MSAHVESSPPTLALAILDGLVADRAMREAVIGDLAEDFARIAAEQSVTAARRWYWSQVLRSALSLSKLSISAGVAPWLRLGISILLGYGVVSALVIMTDMWFMSRNPEVFMPGQQSPTSFLLSAGVISISLGAACAIAAGFFVALIGGRAPFLSALALGIACIGVGVGLINVDGETSPLWYQIGLIVVVTPSALFGAYLFVRLRELLRRLKARLTPLSGNAA